MVTKNKRIGFAALILLLFTSCSFYTDLKDNPRFKDGVIAAPTSFTGSVSSDSNGVITLEWSPVDGAKNYKIYCIKGVVPANKTEEAIKNAATLCYTFDASHVKNNKPRLEISQLSYSSYYFFIKAVSEAGISSIFCKDYVHIFSKYNGSGLLKYREL